MRFTSLCAMIIATLLASITFSHARDALEPFEDRLFRLPETLEGSWEDGRMVVDYDEMRDVNGRDSVPGKRVSMRYITLSVRRAQKTYTYETEAGPVKSISVGHRKKSEIITIYLHGKGGNYKQGADDRSFGGNFNRLKNLMARNNGLYVSAGFRDFGNGGTKQIIGLIKKLKADNPNPKIILACGSAGGLICWRIANDPIGKDLAGIAMLGSFPSGQFISSDAFIAKVPLYIGHGSRDTASPIEGMEAFYAQLKARNYNVKFVRFETGVHGTPIRMTDWRKVINWMVD